jgi:DNA invertase Pin-like site-specific DNA recombinase
MLIGCGRTSTEVRARRAEIEALLASGVGATRAAKQLGIARSSVYRVAAGG